MNDRRIRNVDGASPRSFGIVFLSIDERRSTFDLGGLHCLAALTVRQTLGDVVSRVQAVGD